MLTYEFHEYIHPYIHTNICTSICGGKFTCEQEKATRWRVSFLDSLDSIQTNCVFHLYDEIQVKHSVPQTK